MIPPAPASLRAETNNSEALMDTLVARPQSDFIAASAARVWLARILGGLAVLFLAFDSILKLIRPPMVVQGTVQLGYPPSVILPLGIITLVFLVLYLVPRTAVMGALLWTAYLGGAVASHVRIGDPLFTHTLFPVYVATLLWLGLWLRDDRLRALLPSRKV
jgi:hypothetical protein